MRAGTHGHLRAGVSAVADQLELTCRNGDIVQQNRSHSVGSNGQVDVIGVNFYGRVPLMTDDLDRAQNASPPNCSNGGISIMKGSPVVPSKSEPLAYCAVRMGRLARISAGPSRTCS